MPRALPLSVLVTLVALGCGDDPAGGASAEFLAGGLDRVVVFGPGSVADRCLQVRLVNPTTSGPFPMIATPTAWTVESVSAWTGSPCTADPPADPDLASAGSGTISYTEGAGGGYPCTVTVDITVTFSDGEEALAWHSIPVAGVVDCP